MSLEDDSAQTGNGEGAQKGTEAGGEDAVALMRIQLKQKEVKGQKGYGHH